MTVLRQRMIDAMVQRGFAACTQETCIRAIRRMAKHYRRDPALYTAQDVQAYLQHMVKDQHLSSESLASWLVGEDRSPDIQAGCLWAFEQAQLHAREGA